MVEAATSIVLRQKDGDYPRRDRSVRRILRTIFTGLVVIDPMQAGSAMPLFRQTSRRTLHGELVVRLLPQDFCHCQR